MKAKRTLAIRSDYRHLPARSLLSVLLLLTTLPLQSQSPPVGRPISYDILLPASALAVLEHPDAVLTARVLHKRVERVLETMEHRYKAIPLPRSPNETQAYLRALRDLAEDTRKDALGRLDLPDAVAIRTYVEKHFSEATLQLEELIVSSQAQPATFARRPLAAGAIALASLGNQTPGAHDWQSGIRLAAADERSDKEGQCRFNKWVRCPLAWLSRVLRRNGVITEVRVCGLPHQPPDVYYYGHGLESEIVAPYSEPDNPLRLLIKNLPRQELSDKGCRSLRSVTIGTYYYLFSTLDKWESLDTLEPWRSLTPKKAPTIDLLSKDKDGLGKVEVDCNPERSFWEACDPLEQPCRRDKPCDLD